MNKYIEVDKDEDFILCKKVELYKYVMSEGLVYNKQTNRCLGHTLEAYCDKDGNPPDLSKYEIRFANGETQEIT